MSAILAILGTDAKWSDVIDAIRGEAQAALRAARRYHGGYNQQRQAMLLAFNAEGRVGDPLHYEVPSKLTIRALKSACREARQMGATGVCAEGGIDWFESLPAMMNGEDYEILAEHCWEVVVPGHLFATA